MRAIPVDEGEKNSDLVMNVLFIELITANQKCRSNDNDALE